MSAFSQADLAFYANFDDRHERTDFLANDVEFEDEEFVDILDVDFESVSCATPRIPLKERVFADALRRSLRETIQYPIWMRDAYTDDPYEMDLYFNEELQQSLLDTIEASDLIVNQIAKIALRQELEQAIKKHYFRTQVAEQLITEAMHPRRMMARISQFDNIESFFECC